MFDTNACSIDLVGVTYDGEASSFHDALIFTSDAAHDRPFNVAGRRCVLLGSEAHGVNEIRIHPFTVAHNMRVHGAQATHFQLSRIGAGRTLQLPDCIVHERILVPPDAPGAVLEWSAPHETCIEIQWRVEALAVVRQDGHALTVELPSGDDVVFETDPLEAEWQVSRTAHRNVLELTCRVRIGSAGARLIIASAQDAEALKRATIAAARKGSLARAQQGSLVVRTPDRSIDDAIAWCAHRLRCCVVDVPGLGASLVSGYAAGTEPAFVTRDSVWLGLALLAAGDAALPLDVLRFAVKYQDANGRIPDSCSLYGKTSFGATDATALFLLLAARFTSWTGDFSFAAHAWNAITRASRVVVNESLTAATPLTLVALTEIALVAEGLGKAQASAELHAAVEAHAAAARAAVPATTPRARIPLPVSSDSASARDAQTEKQATAPAQSLLASFVECSACAAFATGQTKAGFEEWQANARASIERNGSARENAAPLDGSLQSAMLMLALVHGIIGAEPDAAKHRLVLRPQIPTEWTTLEAEHLRVGEANITLHYHRDGLRHRYTLEQHAGAVPVRVIFEPLLPASHIISAHIDGEVAELDPRPFGERVLVPVQIVLDHVRTIEIVAG